LSQLICEKDVLGPLQYIKNLLPIFFENWTLPKNINRVACPSLEHLLSASVKRDVGKKGR